MGLTAALFHSAGHGFDFRQEPRGVNVAVTYQKLLLWGRQKRREKEGMLIFKVNFVFES